VRARLHAEIAKALVHPAIRQKLNELGADPMPLTSEQFEALVRRETELSAVTNWLAAQRLVDQTTADKLWAWPRADPLRSAQGQRQCPPPHAASPPPPRLQSPACLGPDSRPRCRQARRPTRRWQATAAHSRRSPRGRQEPQRRCPPP